MTTQVLYVEDDQRLASMVIDYLGGHGVAVTHARDLAAARRVLGRTGAASGSGFEAAWDLLLLDLMLPDGDGLDWCRALRGEERQARLPIIILTARGDAMDRVVGLEIGADDYLPKPFEPRELLARIKAVLRRSSASTTMPAAAVLRFGDLEIDPAARSASVAGKPCALTAYQFDLLQAMASRAGRVLTREQLQGWVKGQAAGSALDSGDAFDRSIDVHIGRIRASIERDVRHPKRIITVRGAGYVFAKWQDSAALPATLATSDGTT